LGQLTAGLPSISSLVCSLFSLLSFVFPFEGLWPSLSFCLPCHHSIRLTNQVLQLLIKQHIQPLQQYPFVTAHVRCWADLFLLAQLREFLRRALEAQALRNRAQTQRGKNLAGNFEADRLTPLQVFSCLRKGKTIASNGIDVHAGATICGRLRILRTTT
jgi:hypothetical protein